MRKPTPIFEFARLRVERVLNSANLSRTFGAPVAVRRSGLRYRLDVGRHAGSFARTR